MNAPKNLQQIICPNIPDLGDICRTQYKRRSHWFVYSEDLSFETHFGLPSTICNFSLVPPRIINERRLIMPPPFPSRYFPIHYSLNIISFDFNRCVSLNRENGPLVSSYFSVFSPVTLRLPLDGFLWNLISRTYKNLPINSKYVWSCTKISNLLYEKINTFIFLTRIINIFTRLIRKIKIQRS